MALTATIFRFAIALSDVERGVYEQLDLRVAMHPSEAMRYMLTRTIAYCLCYEEGIAFSKGLSTTDEPAVWIHAPDGTLLAWIEVGVPSADRLHKASKAAPRVVVFTHQDPALLRKEARSRAIHAVERIEAYALEPSFLDAIGEKIARTTKMELVRNGDQLYATIGGAVIEGAITRVSLVD